MKLISFLALCFLMENTFATTYYFSSTNGNDTRTSTEAQSSATPWKTLIKLNAVFNSLKPGDKVLFKRGDVFTGFINANISGAPGNPILISAYGTGNKPVISGFAVLTNWVSLSNGVWENNDPGFDTSVNVVLINGVPQNIGRYPNITASNGGYLTIDSHVSNSSITDNELTGSTDWTGAEVVIRKRRWLLDRNIVTSRNNKTLNYISASVNTPSDGFGYFLQNQINTLDVFGEWYFNPKARKLGIFFNTNNPSSYQVKASQSKNLVQVYNQQYITLDSLSFEGANGNAVDIFNSSNIIIQNSDISLSGINAVNGLLANYVSVSNSTISRAYNNAISFDKCSNATINDNKIDKTGAVAGMGQSGDNKYIAIFINGSNNLVKYNEVKSTGYLPINFNGNGAMVQNNLIDTFAFVKDDAGGIYVYDHDYQMTQTNNYTGRKILGNIILNGIGAPAGTNDPGLSHACGIFIDNADVTGLEVRDNTIANTPNRGLYVFRSDNIIMKNNTLYNNNIQVSLWQTSGSQFYNNIFFSKFPDQVVLDANATQGDFGTQNGVNTYGSFDSNYYARPLDDDLVINSEDYNSAGTVIANQLDLTRWSQKFNRDKASKTSPLKFPAYKVNSLVGSNIFTNSTFNTNIQGIRTYSPLNNLVASYSSSGGLDGGCVQAAFKTASGKSASSASLVMADIGTVSSGKKYLLKFSLKGSNNNVSINAYLRNFNYPYNNFTKPQYRKIGTTRSENEVLFSFPTGGSATLVFEVDDQNVEYWLDNLQLYEVNADISNPDDYLRFEYNATKVNKTVTLDASYVDVTNTSYSGSLTLKPYTSVILLKKAQAGESGILEAELAVLNKAVVSSSVPGYTGTGFADYINKTGDFIEWTLNKVKAGAVSLSFRYANASTANRPLKLEVNGVVVSAGLDFPSTGTWTKWSIKSIIANNLVAGANKIRLTAIGYSGGNIDHLAWNDASARVNTPLNNISNATTLDLINSTAETSLGAFVMPNPVSDHAKLFVKTSSDLPVEVTIVDILGKLHRHFSYNSFKTGYLDLSVTNLSPGTYFITARQGGEKTSTKFIVK